MVIIRLTCPECGRYEWIPLEDGFFRCSTCGLEIAPENMTAECVEVQT